MALKLNPAEDSSVALQLKLTADSTAAPELESLGDWMVVLRLKTKADSRVAMKPKLAGELVADVRPEEENVVAQGMLMAPEMPSAVVLHCMDRCQVSAIHRSQTYHNSIGRVI